MKIIIKDLKSVELGLSISELEFDGTRSELNELMKCLVDKSEQKEYVVNPYRD